MATGRGWFYKQYSDQLKKQGAEGYSPPSLPHSSYLTYSNGKHQNSKDVSNKFQSKIFSRRKTAKDKKISTFSNSKKLYIASIPPELWLKIFSYLDPVSLLSVGSVNTYFYKLSKDNLIWSTIYSSYSLLGCSSWKPKIVDSVAESLNFSDIKEKEPGYWKNVFMRKIITERRKKKTSQILSSVKCLNGVPTNIETVIKKSGLSWALTFKDRNGKEMVMEQMDICFRHTSITVVWCGLQWPSLKTLTQLQVHGLTPVIFNKSMIPSKNGPKNLSLIAKYDLKNLMETKEFIGQDRLVKLLYLKPGLLLAVWKRSFEIAFVIANLHYHHLLELSLLGVSDRIYEIPPHVAILDDVDPNYGLYGYELHIELHSGPWTFFSGTFRRLFCRREYIKDGFLRLSVIGLKNSKQHAPLVGNLGLSWKTETFEGIVQNCFIMDLTLLDETENPFWCFSAPVSLRSSKTTETVYDFMGETFYIKYQDSTGKVSSELVWMKESDEYYIVYMVLFLSTEKVNNWFGTKY
ncbi:hypothetical protein GDO86_011163 [Hymenochirus boettgeri]|uniref:F-box domain-containing protein n=1 Tax=Hymenochirus boettgeri TaxID=247094 RepID=A0A8T2JIG3_9PIPI|nr:hypothetical protein GDO86_011163 [Hymenochirus boettgeri]